MPQRPVYAQLSTLARQQSMAFQEQRRQDVGRLEFQLHRAATIDDLDAQIRSGAFDVQDDVTPAATPTPPVRDAWAQPATPQATAQQPPVAPPPDAVAGPAPQTALPFYDLSGYGQPSATLRAGPSLAPFGSQLQAPGFPTASADMSAPGQPTPGLGAGASPTGAPTQGGEIEAYIRQSAARRGIDPDTAVAVAMSEGGLDDPVRQSDVVNNGVREPSYGPFQLYMNGGLGNRALQQGIDPRDPNQWRQAVDFSLDEAARGGWGPWHGAARVGIGDRQGIGTYRGPVPEAAPPARGAAAAPPIGTYAPENLVPNQFTEGQAQGLTAAEAIAVCGPAAAVAFARANGRNPTLREAKELAGSLGLWDQDVGMHGPASQVQLLGRMGVPATLQEGTDWSAVAREVQAGRPVILDSPSHYYVATGYDPQTGEFEFGASAGVLKASGGKTRWRPDQIPALGMGDIRATIFMGRGQ